MITESKHKIISITSVVALILIAIILRCIGFNLWNNEKVFTIGILVFLSLLCMFVMMDKLEWNINNSLVFVSVWIISIICLTICGMFRFNEWIPYYVPVIIVAIIYGTDSGFCFNLFSGIYYSVIWCFGENLVDISILIKLLLIGCILILSLKHMNNLTQIIFTGMSVLFATGIVNILYYNLKYDKADIISLLKGFVIIGITYFIGFLVTIWKKLNYKDKTTSFEMADELCNEEFEAIKNYKIKYISSYQHAVNVSELACLVARKVDADIGMVRVGSIYHEIGKSEKPDDYVNEGLLICDQFNLPDFVKSIIIEHCLKIRNPRTIESAIVMLADSVLNSMDYAKANNQIVDNKKIIENVIKVRLESGVLDECNMTIDKFNKIKRAFIDAY